MLRQIVPESLNTELYWLGEWLHQNLGHTGKEALYFEAQNKGCPINRKTKQENKQTNKLVKIFLQIFPTVYWNYKQIILLKHYLYISIKGKLYGFSGRLVIFYIGPFKSSVGYWYILKGVEVVSSLLIKWQKTDGQNTIWRLLSCYSHLPTHPWCYPK